MKNAPNPLWKLLAIGLAAYLVIVGATIYLSS